MGHATVSGRIPLFALALAAGHLACAPAPSGNHVAPVITERVDESNLVALGGNVRPEVRLAGADRGRVPDGFTAEHMLLQLGRGPAAEHALEQALADLQTPGSPRFHQWLTAQEYGDQFGLADQDLAAVRGFLEAHGLRVNSVNTARTVIDFSGSAAALRSAFRTELHALSVNGVDHIANVSDPQIPAALAPAVIGVVSMHDFRPHTNVKPRPAYTFTNQGTTLQALVPADLATIYNLTPLFSAGTSGQGQTIVVVEDSDVFDPADWTTFRNKFGLGTYTAGTFTASHPAPASGVNNCTPPGTNGADGEAILDAEWASASAPSAAIVVASCADTAFTFGGLLALDNLLNESTTPPAVVSMSYGECEAANGAAGNAAFKAVYQQAVAEGVSVFVSSGDEGAASCDANQTSAQHGISVSGFASTPYNVAVGGTDFGDTYAHSNSTYWSSHNSSTFGSALSYIPEIPWNNSCASTLLASQHHYPLPYGGAGFCNGSTGEANFLTTGSGSGGPSGCATGTPATPGIVSGACRGWAKPSWQAIYGMPDDGVRDIPDVSLFAANGVWNHYLVYCDTDPNDGSCDGDPSGWPGAGGTSFASPIMAGIQALVDQKWGRQGNPNPTYYKIASGEFGTSGSSDCNSTKGKGVASSCVFNDVTLGDIDVNCLGPYSCYTPSGDNGVLSTANSGYGPAFAARAGWDFATGIGSVNAANLVNSTAWAAGHAQVGGAPTHR